MGASQRNAWQQHEYEQTDPAFGVTTPGGNETNKSVFEVKEPQSVFAVPEEGDENYNGPNRRKVDRRTAHDRRTEVRFDLKATDRRENPGGRRSDDVKVNFW